MVMSDSDTNCGPSQLTLVNPVELPGNTVFGKILKLEGSRRKTRTPQPLLFISM